VTHLSKAFIGSPGALVKPMAEQTISRFCAARMTTARADAVGLGVILRYLTKRSLGPVGGALAARPAYGLHRTQPPWVR